MSDSKETVTVNSVQPITPQNEALYDTGKELLKNSVTVGRDFCQLMITLSTGAIATYLALLAFVVPKDTVFSVASLILAITPPFIFLISTGIFVVGYLPMVTTISLDIVDEIKNAYERTIKQRRYAIIIGMIVFIAANIVGIYVVGTFALGSYSVKP